MMGRELDGRLAIVIGGHRGIGRAIADALAEAGADVHVFDVGVDGEEASLPYPLHVVDVADAATAIGSLLAPVTLVVNNARITRDRFLVKMSDAEWGQVLSINLTGAFNVIRAAAPTMIAAGFGRVVNITTVSSGNLERRNIWKRLGGRYISHAGTELRFRVTRMRRSTIGIASPPAAESHGPIRVRRAVAADLLEIIALDEAVTGIAKEAYWRDVFERYGERLQDERFFLVAEAADDGRGIVGFIIGEIRAWEFGSEPCGWVFAFSVRPEVRLKGIGRQLFAALSKAFRRAGVRTMRTMVARDNTLHMMFFRSEGMMAGRYLQLEKSLDEDLEGAAS